MLFWTLDCVFPGISAPTLGLPGAPARGGGPSRQSLEPSHRPTLLSPLESHSATYIVGSAGNPLVPPLLPVFLTGHSLGQLSKEEESHHLITSKSSTYPRMCLSGLLWLMPPWGDTQPHLGGDSFLGRTLIHAEPGLLVCRFSGDVCRVGFLCVSGERRFWRPSPCGLSFVAITLWLYNGGRDYRGPGLQAAFLGKEL